MCLTHSHYPFYLCKNITYHTVMSNDISLPLCNECTLLCVIGMCSEIFQFIDQVHDIWCVIDKENEKYSFPRSVSHHTFKKKKSKLQEKQKYASWQILPVFLSMTLKQKLFWWEGTPILPINKNRFWKFMCDKPNTKKCWSKSADTLIQLY